MQDGFGAMFLFKFKLSFPDKTKPTHISFFLLITFFVQSFKFCFVCYLIIHCKFTRFIATVVCNNLTDSFCIRFPLLLFVLTFLNPVVFPEEVVWCKDRKYVHVDSDHAIGLAQKLVLHEADDILCEHDFVREMLLIFEY